MSQNNQDREGLSPPPPNILDLFQDDDESDDIYEPTTEESEIAATNEDESEEFMRLGMLTGHRCTRSPARHRESTPVPGR
jgi:hypothetical protein